MSNITKFCAIFYLSLALGAHMLYAHKNSTDTPEALSTEEYSEENQAWSGMFFSTENVVEEYEYDDAYCLLYDDADANMFNVEICVDLETYQMVQNAIKSGNHLVGTLVLNDDYSYDNVDVFTYMEDPEFEMAEASADYAIKKCVIPMYQQTISGI